MFLLLAALIQADAASAGVPLTAAPFAPGQFADLADRDVVSVLLLGDSGVGTGFVPVAAAAAAVCFAPTRAVPCDLALLVGDNVYNEGITAAGAQEWIDAFATPMAPFVARAKGDTRFRAWVVAGNHDWAQHSDPAGELRIAAEIATTTDPANAAIGDLWQYPALAYEVPGLPRWLHLHALDTQTLVDGKTAGLDVTRKRMKHTSGWDVVFGHHVPASSGGHGQDGETDDETYAAALQTLRRVGLDLVLAGHDHHQELLESGGVPVVIQGNSSKGRDVGVSKYTPCSKWKTGGKDARGFAIATFRKDTVAIEFFDGTGAALKSAEYSRKAIPKRGAVLGTCPG